MEMNCRVVIAVAKSSAPKVRIVCTMKRLPAIADLPSLAS